MSPLVLAVVAATMVDGGGGTAIALDDGTVWLIADGAWEELGACEDGEVRSLEEGGGELSIECGDGSQWRWSPGSGWAARAEAAETTGMIAHEPTWARSWWPLLELSVRIRRADQPVYEGWVRLQWDL